jgi:hypothetical protein
VYPLSMRSLTVVLMFLMCSSSSLMAEEQASIVPKKQLMVAEHPKRSNEDAKGFIDRKNLLLNPSTIFKKNLEELVLEKISLISQELDDKAKKLESSYNQNGIMDEQLMNSIQTDLQRYQKGLSQLEKAKLPALSKAVLEKHFTKTRIKYSQIALAMAGIHTQTIHETVSEFQSSVKNTIRAENKLLSLLHQ